MKYSQKTLHSSPERARYGVSFVSSKGNILCRLVKIEPHKIFAIINRAIKGLHCMFIYVYLVMALPRVSNKTKRGLFKEPDTPLDDTLQETQPAEMRSLPSKFTDTYHPGHDLAASPDTWRAIFIRDKATENKTVQIDRVTHLSTSLKHCFYKSSFIMTSSNGNIFRVTGSVRGIHQSPVNSLHNGKCRGALMFSMICASLNSWANHRDAGDLRTPLRSLWHHCNGYTCHAIWFISLHVYNIASIGTANLAPGHQQPLWWRRPVSKYQGCRYVMASG